VESGFRYETDIARRRRLPLRQTVDLIIVNQVGDVMIAPHGVDEVIAAFTISIPIAADGNDSQLRVGTFRANSRWYRPAVEGIEGVALQVMRQFTCLSDAGDHEYLMRLETEPDERLFNRIQYPEVTAARTPGAFQSLIVRYRYHSTTLQSSVRQ